MRRCCDCHLHLQRSVTHEAYLNRFNCASQAALPRLSDIREGAVIRKEDGFGNERPYYNQAEESVFTGSPFDTETYHSRLIVTQSFSPSDNFFFFIILTRSVV